MARYRVAIWDGGDNMALRGIFDDPVAARAAAEKLLQGGMKAVWVIEVIHDLRPRVIALEVFNTD